MKYLLKCIVKLNYTISHFSSIESFQVCGLVFLETQVVDTLLNLSVAPPLDSCTYLGLDAGSRPTANVMSIFIISANKTYKMLRLFLISLL